MTPARQRGVLAPGIFYRTRTWKLDGSGPDKWLEGHTVCRPTTVSRRHALKPE